MPVASIEAGDLCKVWEIKTLGKAWDGEARSLLERISKQVQPIMRNRRWRVMLLCEFWPSNPALLGLNVGGGQEIRIRLRKPGNEFEFLPYEDLLGTMLHELTHNEHGPHDAKFYKLLDDLTKECEDLMVRGISGTGQGFDGPGKRLGGYSHNVPISSVRQAALAAAERRARTGSLMPSGPRRLGGDSDIMRALSPVQAAAMAAERRSRDDLWCAAPDTLGEDGLQKAKEREETQANLELLGSGKNVMRVNNLKGDGSGRGEAGPSRNDNLKEKQDTYAEASDVLRGNASGGTGMVSRFGIAKSPERTGNDKDNTRLDAGSSNTTNMWECSICTLLNPPLSIVCSACMSVKSEQKKEEVKNWTCKYCTLENPVILDNCAACSQWRYSYGPPVSVRGPYVGT